MKVKKINVKRMLAILAIVAATHSKGFTYNIQENALQTEGYAVALSATQNSFDAEGLLNVVEYAIKHNIQCIGGLLDKKTGKFYFDATVIVKNKIEAIALGKANKQIAIAVKAGGPEPENNPTLRSVIANCKRENMPKDNIERAIKNAMGKDQSDYKEVTYEGYGPHGIAIFVDTLTDNTTRTVGDVRSVFNKFSGTLGTTGSLAYLFDHKCVFTFKKKDGLDMEELVLELIDLNVEDEYDEDEEEGTITIYGDPKSYAQIQKFLEEQGFEDIGGEFTYIPNDLKDIDGEARETIDKMVERLEEFDDVQNVYTNMKPVE